MNSSPSTTQAQLESRYLDQRNRDPGSGDLPDLSDAAVRRSWTLSLDRRQAVLNPKDGQWSVWDPAHREYIPTDLPAGAGILFEHQSAIALKLIPRGGSEDARIWHTGATSWQSPSEVFASLRVEAAPPPSTETSCSACAHPLPEGAKFCPECGERVRTKRCCTGCSAEFDSLPRFCPECGLARILPG